MIHSASLLYTSRLAFVYVNEMIWAVYIRLLGNKFAGVNTYTDLSEAIKDMYEAFEHDHVVRATLCRGLEIRDDSIIIGLGYEDLEG